MKKRIPTPKDLLLFVVMGLSFVYLTTCLAQPELELTGIIGGDKPIAIVNGEILSVGDEIQGAKVLQISGNSVLFKYKDTVITKVLEEETGEKEHAPPERERIEKRKRKAEVPAEVQYPVSEPPLPEYFVGRPRFFTLKGSFTAGAAFLIQMEGKKSPALITAQHIFVSARGLKQRVSPADLPRFTRKVVLLDFVSGGKLKTAVESISLSPAKQDRLDLAAFWATPDDGCSPGKLSGSNPSVNQTVWLAAPAKGGASRERLLHKARITAVNGDRAMCLFENKNLVFSGVSGAPYLNAAGEVTGMHVESSIREGKVTGTMIPAESIRSALKDAE